MSLTFLMPWRRNKNVSIPFSWNFLCSSCMPRTFHFLLGTLGVCLLLPSPAPSCWFSFAASSDSFSSVFITMLCLSVCFFFHMNCVINWLYLIFRYDLFHVNKMHDHTPSSFRFICSWWISSSATATSGGTFCCSTSSCSSTWRVRSSSKGEVCLCSDLVEQ